MKGLPSLGAYSPLEFFRWRTGADASPGGQTSTAPRHTGEIGLITQTRLDQERGRIPRLPQLRGQRERAPAVLSLVERIRNCLFS